MKISGRLQYAARAHVGYVGVQSEGQAKNFESDSLGV